MQSERGLSAVTVPDTNRFIDGGDKDLAVANLSGPGGGGERSDDLFRAHGWNEDLELTLGSKSTLHTLRIIRSVLIGRFENDEGVPGGVNYDGFVPCAMPAGPASVLPAPCRASAKSSVHSQSTSCLNLSTTNANAGSRQPSRLWLCKRLLSARRDGWFSLWRDALDCNTSKTHTQINPVRCGRAGESLAQEIPAFV